MSPGADKLKTTAPSVAAHGDEERTIALEALERALGQPPAELTAEVDVAERAIARLRNRLIAGLRAAPADGDAHQRRRALDAANVALSLVAGVEYPAAGIQRTLLEQAREHAERVMLERRQRAEIAELGLPTCELEMVGDGIDLGGLYRLAESVRKQWEAA